MPKRFPRFRSLLNQLRDTLFKGLFRARFRYDVFISYSHRDAEDYAANLKQQLTALDFSCFIDEEEAPAGSSLDPTLVKALKKSAVLVLLATERALVRPYIISEFEKFAATQRTIVPINILEALTRNEEAALSKAPWKIIKDRNLVWLDEGADAFAKQNPSPKIADGIDKLFKYTRRNTRVRTEIIGTATIVLVAAFGAGMIIKGKNADLRTTQNNLNAQVKLLDQAKLDTGNQQVAAALARAESMVQLANAKQAKAEADQANETAKVATAEATKQRSLAAVAKLEADRQLERNRHMTYAANVSLAPQAYESGSVNHASELLDDVLRSPGSAGKEDLRGFEWYYLAGLYERKLAQIEAHPGPITSTAFSPDGKLIATGSRGTFKLWDAASQQLLKKLGEENEVAPSDSNQNADEFQSAVAFSPTDPIVATCSWNGICSLWDTKSYKLLATLAKGDKAQSVSVGFSPNGRMVAVGVSMVYEIWDTSSYTSIRKFESDPQGALYGTALAFSNDNQTIAISTGYGIELHEIASQEGVTLPRRSGATRTMTYAQDGQSLLTGGEQGVAIYSLQKQDVIKTWSPRERAPSAFFRTGNVVCFSPDGKEFATGEVDKVADGGEVKLWDANTSHLLASFKGVGNQGEVSSLAFSPDDRVLSVGGRRYFQLNDAVPARNSNIVKTSTISTSVAFFLTADASQRRKWAKTLLMPNQFWSGTRHRVRRNKPRLTFQKLQAAWRFRRMVKQWRFAEKEV